jgi:hypothetical protein
MENAQNIIQKLIQFKGIDIIDVVRNIKEKILDDKYTGITRIDIVENAIKNFKKNEGSYIYEKLNNKENVNDKYYGIFLFLYYVITRRSSAIILGNKGKTNKYRTELKQYSKTGPKQIKIEETLSSQQSQPSQQSQLLQSTAGGGKRIMTKRKTLKKIKSKKVNTKSKLSKKQEDRYSK